MTDSTPKHVLRRPTMAEVASASGVARSTVSGILNRRADCTVRPETRQRVFDAIERLGYHPNAYAQALVTGQTMTLGVVTAGLDVEPSNAILMAFEQIARPAGYLCLFLTSPNEACVEDQLLSLLEARGVDGILLFPSEFGPHRQLQRLLERGLPVVTIDNHGRLDLPVDDVSVDHYLGGVFQADHLLAHGRRNVCVVTATRTCRVVEQRIKGLTERLTESGAPSPLRLDLPFDARPSFQHRSWTDENRNTLRSMLERQSGRIDAVVGTADSLAVLAMSCLHDSGVAIPDEVAVIGYDGTILADNAPLPLTTVRTPTSEVANAAFDLLMNRMNGSAKRADPATLLLQPTLVPRPSTLGKP